MHIEQKSFALQLILLSLAVAQILWPFFGAMLLVLAAVTYIPALSLWLPGLLLGK